MCSAKGFSAYALHRKNQSGCRGLRPGATTAGQTVSEVEQHIQHVTLGLIDGVVPQNEAHPTHTLADRMKELNVPGVSVAVIRDGPIEWPRGFPPDRACLDPR